MKAHPKPHILICLHHPGHRSNLYEHLRGLGYRVSRAGNPTEAIAVANQRGGKVSLLIADAPTATEPRGLDLLITLRRHRHRCAAYLYDCHKRSMPMLRYIGTSLANSLKREATGNPSGPKHQRDRPR